MTYNGPESYNGPGYEEVGEWADHQNLREIDMAREFHREQGHVQAVEALDDVIYQRAKLSETYAGQLGLARIRIAELEAALGL